MTKGDLHLSVAIISPFQLRVRRGIEASACNLASHLVALGQSVTLLCWSGPLPCDRNFLEAGGNYCIMPSFRYLEAKWAALFYAQTFLRLEPNIVLVHFAGYGEAAALGMTRLIWRPSVVFVVGYPFELVPHRFVEFKAWRLDQHLAGIVIKARHMAPSIAQFFGQQVYYIPNGVDLTSFRPDTTNPYHIKGKIPQLVSIAAIEKRKGFELVLAALPTVIRQFGPVHYTIVGDGPDKVWLEEYIQHKELAAYVTMVGSQNNILSFLQQADIFLLPSYGEGLPNAYLEALAMGLPTIVSNDPPYDDIAHPEFSIRVDRTDSQAMGAAIVQLLSDPTLRKRMGEAARREAEQAYAWPVVAKHYLAVFHELINKK